MSRDANDLVISRRQIENKISSTDKKIDRLASILQKKFQINGVTPDQVEATKDGYRVSDYRYHLMNDHLNTSIKQIKSETISSKTRANNSSSSSLTYQRPHNDNVFKQKCKHIAKDLENKEAIVIAKRKQREGLKPTIPSVPQSFLPNRYVRGELPCTIEHGANGNFLSWACPLENLDFEYYLPIFFDGLQCKEYPVCFLARQGVEDMLFWARNEPNKVRNCMKNLIRPLRNALSIHDTDVILGTLKAIQHIIKAHCATELVPYCKQFITPLTKYMSSEVNIGDQIDFGQRKNHCIGEQVRITLELLEDNGGPKAYATIKASIPTCKYLKNKY